MSDTAVHKVSEKMDDAASAASETAQDLKHQARDAFSTVSDQARHFINASIEQRLSSGTEFVGAFAASLRAAADELDKTSPPVARLVNTGADRIEGFADNLKGQSLDDVIASAGEYSRRNPALVAGLAFAGALVLTRLLAGSGTVLKQAIDTGAQRATSGRKS